ncbi:hypothetical protein A1O1_07121 [Capronia coronata CBS 617.96]|uniref:Amino acid permease/ SLC12A domain-containing protein n=1 Tax=Capronia coronata CBS 617.96 TaxID=1182541 RepID=W9XTF5_9EURO|nr:uncharacterized protein A1O1_07121 [Capronia coronata CBS 617.96]EXJ83498.1 hypothetical protein A1O1_07121 [Capronia coronata CBS 617.96]
MAEKRNDTAEVIAPSSTESQLGTVQELSNDALQLAALGHKEELERNFGLLALAGLGFVCSGSWSGVAQSLVAAILSGGPSVLVYGALIIPSMIIFVVLSLAEIASAYPTTAGPLEWTYRLAPRKHAAFLSWMTGWSNMLSWIVGASANVAVMTFQIVFLANLFHPSYESKSWHVFLIMEALLILNCLMNVFGTRILPLVDTAGFWWFLASFFVVGITAVAAANPHQPAKFVFATFINQTGWDNSFVVFMNGLIITAGNFVALDSISHLSEEMPNPSRTVPRAMIMTITIGALTDFIVCILLMFSVGQDIEEFFNSGAPYLTIMLTSTGSKAAVACISTMQLVNNFNSTTSVIQVGSRIIWAFARDGGFIFPKYFSKVNKSLACPVPAVIMSWAIAALISVLYLASTTAFNALMSCLVILGYFAYGVPILCLLLRGRVLDREGTFKLGKAGWTINILALCFMSFLTIFFCFPVYLPATKNNMNYASLVSVGLMLIAYLLWIFVGKKNFKGPSLAGIVVADDAVAQEKDV